MGKMHPVVTLNDIKSAYFQVQSLVLDECKIMLRSCSLLFVALKYYAKRIWFKWRRMKKKYDYIWDKKKMFKLAFWSCLQYFRYEFNMNYCSTNIMNIESDKNVRERMYVLIMWEWRVGWEGECAWRRRGMVEWGLWDVGDVCVHVDE